MKYNVHTPLGHIIVCFTSMTSTESLQFHEFMNEHTPPSPTNVKL